MTDRASDRPSAGRTFIGYAPAPRACDEHEPVGAVDAMDDVGAIESLLSDLTSIERGATVSAGPGSDAALSLSMLDELRRRLRAAEQREREQSNTARSGVRAKVDAEMAEASLDDAEDFELDIDIDSPILPEEAEEALGALPELDAALAPNSESNFYGGFEEDVPSGVFVATYDRLPVGATVFLRVHLPGGHRFRTPATVEFVREPEAAQPGIPVGIGLRLRGVDARMSHLISTFARYRAPMFYMG